ncbi:hypothetical protein AC578_9434 [Pseudocercospora eumusae]|uniref:Fungal N-terminal domain-containing protein n=1 Tax=Pseudocercospora eumusae TaxID=321146 RepID=A0A139H2J6_9PEZI|nr:hypothetical protein AC578_9434 [Pseudocercospora eumusae]
MADPLSIAAAAAGFLGLAGQLASGTLKLRRLYKSTENAPRKVSELISAMQDLHDALQSAGEMLQTATAAGSRAQQAAQRCLMQCERLQRKLDARLSKLEKKFQKHSSRRFLFVFHEEEVDGILQDLERCKTSLLVSQQAFGFNYSGSILDSIATRQDAFVSRQTQVQADMSCLTQQSKHNQAKILRQYENIKSQTDTIHSDLSKLSASVNTIQSSIDSQQDNLRQGNQTIIQEIMALQQKLATVQRYSLLGACQGEDILQAVRQFERKIAALEDRLAKTGSESEMTFSVGFQLFPMKVTIERRVVQSGTHSSDSPIRRSTPSRGDAIFDLRLPVWFVQDQYRFAVNHSSSGWRYNIRHYRQYYYANLNPLMKACANGDIATAKDILRSGTVCPHDRDSRGLTASDHAVTSPSNEIYEFMASQGLTYQASEYDLAKNVTRNRSDFRSFSRINHRLKHVCEVTGIRIDDLPTIFGDIEGAGETISLAIYPRLPSTERVPFILKHAMEIILWGRDDEVEEDIYTILKDVPHEPRYLGQLSVDDGLISLLHLGAIMTARRGKYSSFWHSLSLGALAAGVDLSLEQPERYLTGSFWGTPLAMFIRETLDFIRLFGFAFTITCHQEKTINRALFGWATMLHDYGIDLETYGVEESELLKQGIERAKATPSNRASDTRMYYWLPLVSRMLTGPQPQDWKFVYSTDAFTSTLSDFWIMTERSMEPADLLMKLLVIKSRVEASIKIPGAWRATRSKSVKRILKGLVDMEAHEYELYVESVRCCDMREAYDRLDLGSFEVSELRDDHMDKAWQDEILGRVKQQLVVEG